MEKMAEEMKQADLKEEEIKARMAQQQAEFEAKIAENQRLMEIKRREADAEVERQLQEQILEQ